MAVLRKMPDALDSWLAHCKRCHRVGRVVLAEPWRGMLITCPHCEAPIVVTRIDRGAA